MHNKTSLLVAITVGEAGLLLCCEIVPYWSRLESLWKSACVSAAVCLAAD